MSKKKKVFVNPDDGEVLEHLNTPSVWTQLTSRHRDKKPEMNYLPSKTVPGQSMTIQEMVKRHRQGLPIDESKGALYQGEELLPDISNMDLVDRQAYMDSVADALVEVKARIQASAKTTKEKEILDRIDVAVREKLKELADNQKNRNSVTDLPTE